MSDARELAFRYLYKSGVIKENTVTVFGELGQVFVKGADYDEEVDLTVPYMDLSNLIMYYTGTVADGTVGSSVEGSLRNLNAPVTNVRKFLKFSNYDHATEANHYYIGDIVLYDPITGNGTSVNASCWTCIKTTTDLTSPIPELANEIANAFKYGGSNGVGATYNNNPNNPGMTGIDNRGQRFITGVMPAIYNGLDGTIKSSPYWRESALAKSYLTSGNYYQGELVVYNGGVYQCKSTNGFLADPQLYQRVKYTKKQEDNDAAGITNAPVDELIPALDRVLAPQGAFGYDSSGTRYLMGVAPTGSMFSGLFWQPATLPKVPSGAYLNINWDNTSVTNKLQFYDANVVGGAGAQSIPTFNDDMGNTITTLRKIYDDNEKSFVLTTANQILATIPAAAIKSQAVSSKVEPDNTLVELVHLGPSNSKPSEYTPAVQGLFEESVARDMLRISGYANTITEFVVTEGSSGYKSVPNVQIIGGLATNPKLVPFYAKAIARLGVKNVKINKTDVNWDSAKTGKKYGVGDVLTFAATASPKVACTAKVYRVDSAGNILSVLITNKGSGYTTVPEVKIAGTVRTFLEANLEVLSVELEARDVGFVDNMKVVVQYGSGAGAVGYAVTEQVNGVTRLVKVEFDGTTKNDPSGQDYNISRGSNYVAGKYKKDVVALQGYRYDSGTTSWVALPLAKSIGIVTTTEGSAIAKLVVINNGSGYTANPSVVIGAPDADARENGKLRRNSNSGNVELKAFLPPIETSGIYANGAVPIFSRNDPLLSEEAKKVQGKAYLGLNTAEARFGGNGYSIGEYMNVSGGGIVPATFNITYDASSDKYEAIVIEGGNDYSFDSLRVHQNEIILQDDTFGADEGDQLRAQIMSVGGGIVELSFNNGRPSGENFAVDDVIEATTATPTDTFRFKVTSVGDEGTIAPGGYTLVSEAVTSGYVVGATLLAKSKFLSIDKLTLEVAQAFSSPNQPSVSIPAPTGSVTLNGSTWTPVQAVAEVSLKVSNISISKPGSGYQLGDSIMITQPGAVTCEAFVLALADNDLGSVGVIAVRNPGSGFNLAKTGVDEIKVTLPTTTGTPLAVTVSYSVHTIVVTNPGAGYERTAGSNPVVTLTATGGVSHTLSVTTKNAGESTATFLVASVDGNGLPAVTQLSPGADYLVGDLLALQDSDKNGVGAYVTVETTQSRGVKTATIVPGYIGTTAVVSATLRDATCRKIGSTALYPAIKYAVTKVTSPTSISSLRILEYKPGPAIPPALLPKRYGPITLSHKPHARVKVANVDSLGSILSLTVESQGYGYKTIPMIKPMSVTRGVGASLFGVSLGVSRVEFSGAALSVITSTDIVVSRDGILDAPRKAPATAIAQLAGDLNTISTDPLKNPNILETLELLKPGSTTGYGQAKPSMGVSSVEVVYNGRGYNMGQTASGVPGVPPRDITYVEVTEPDLPNGEKPTFDIKFDATKNDGSISNIEVLTPGRGYSKFPKAIIRESVTPASGEGAFVKLKMKLVGTHVTSGGQGYLTKPSVSVTLPDVNIGQSDAVPVVTMKASINGFNIPTPGAQYLTTPEALVVGPGNGAEAIASMGVSDIYIVKGGTGYSVGDMLVFSAPTGTKSANANATVLEVTTPGGSITRVGFVKSMFPIVAATLKAAKNDFILNGGSGYMGLPTIDVKLKTPAGSTADLYDPTTKRPVDTLVDSNGSGAVFSTRLGVSRIDFTNRGNDYESDATVLIQDPPSSQQANFSAIINGVGQLSTYVKNSSGSGYTAPPAAVIEGNGAGATITPVMGVTEVAIVTSGHGYRVGDVVNFVGGTPEEAATGVVTVIDRGGSGIGYDLNLSVAEAVDGRPDTLSVGSDGKLVGMVGAIKTPLILEGGYEFEEGDIISLKPETRFPSSEALDSIRTIRSATTIESGKLTLLSLINNIVSNDFKAGMILKVTSLNPTLSAAVAYVRINVVLDDISGTGWHSINDQFDANGALISHGSYISAPGDKYGRLIPALYYDYDNTWGGIGYVGIQGEASTVLASNAEWGSDTTLITSDNITYDTQKLKFEVVKQDDTAYPGSTAYFKVTQTLKSVGAIILAEPWDPVANSTTASTGKFYSVYDLNQYTGIPRGRISFIQVLNPGRGYQSNPTAVINSATKDIDAKVVVSLGVISLRIVTPGAGYTSNPDIKIEAPHHRALTAKGYARSGVFDLDAVEHEFEVTFQGAGYTGETLDSTGNPIPGAGGTYQLVGGALHQTGGSAESIDTVVTIQPSGFVGGLLVNEPGTIRAATNTVVRGSNYRVGDVLLLMPIGATRSDNQATSAKIRIKSIGKRIDYDNGMGASNAEYNTGAGILDYGKRYPPLPALDGEDVGGYGTGYFEPPYVTIVGGNQGVTLATSLGLVAVDKTFEAQSGGLDYQVGDLVQMVSPEFSDPVDVGVVSRVDSYIGEVMSVTIYEPYSKGLNKMPSVSVVRTDPTHRSTWSATKVAAGDWVRKDAALLPVLGVTVATTTTSADGFIGRPYVFVAPPNGIGYIQQPTSARITPNVVNEVSEIEILYTRPTIPEYITTLPIISVAPPPTIEKYSGWRSVRFNQEDSFEAIVQYTIAKAVSFQVDPDATLPGYYFTASAITIGGVVIPLRQSGGKGMQGRELSSNRIIRRYKVKLIGV